jgi:hypothetical protein
MCIVNEIAKRIAFTVDESVLDKTNWKNRSGDFFTTALQDRQKRRQALNDTFNEAQVVDKSMFNIDFKKFALQKLQEIHDSSEEGKNFLFNLNKQLSQKNAVLSFNLSAQSPTDICVVQNQDYKRLLKGDKDITEKFTEEQKEEFKQRDPKMKINFDNIESRTKVFPSTISNNDELFIIHYNPFTENTAAVKKQNGEIDFVTKMPLIHSRMGGNIKIKDGISPSYLSFAHELIHLSHYLDSKENYIKLKDDKTTEIQKEAKALNKIYTGQDAMKRAMPIWSNKEEWKTVYDAANTSELKLRLAAGEDIRYLYQVETGHPIEFFEDAETVLKMADFSRKGRPQNTEKPEHDLKNLFPLYNVLKSLPNATSLQNESFLYGKYLFSKYNSQSFQEDKNILVKVPLHEDIVDVDKIKYEISRLEQKKKHYENQKQNIPSYGFFNQKPKTITQEEVDQQKQLKEKLKMRIERKVKKIDFFKQLSRQTDSNKRFQFLLNKMSPFNNSPSHKQSVISLLKLKGS